MKLTAFSITSIGALLASTVSFADGLSQVEISDTSAAAMVSQSLVSSGNFGNGAYSIAPSWSEDLGFSLNGAIGYTLDEKSALGLVVTGGEKQREALLNFGFTIDAERQIVLSAGQLQEKLTFGEGEVEWVKQNEFGIAYDATNYSLNIFHVDSETTDNFMGAKSTGAEMEGTVALSNLASLDYGVGYEKLEWDDGSVGEEGVTGRLSLDVQANDATVVNVFADHNLSANQYGVGATWAFGAGSLTASYTYIEGLVGAVEDDQRVSFAFTMPLGATPAKGNSVSTGSLVRSSDGFKNLLAEVMKRPEYLPSSVIVASDLTNYCSDPISNPADNGSATFIIWRDGGIVDYVSVVLSRETWNGTGTDDLLQTATLTIDGIQYTSDESYFSSSFNGQPGRIEWFDFYGLPDPLGTSAEFDLPSLGVSCVMSAVFEDY